MTSAPARLDQSGVISGANLDSFLSEQGLPDRNYESMLAPGQETLLDDFLKEQGANDGSVPLGSDGADDIPKKFKGKSATEIARAYEALEKLASSKGIQPPAPAAPAVVAEPGIPDPASYTAEKGQAEYGQQLAAAFTAVDVNPYQLWRDAAGGADVSQQAAAIARELGVAESVVTNYIAANAKPVAAQAQAPGAQAELSEADGRELKALVGGEDEFNKLADWARVNAKADLPAYMEAVNSGNKAAVGAWLKAFQAQREAGLSVEPPLEGGGSSPQVERFGSREEVFEAMRKTNTRGQRLYDVDPAYQRKFTEKLARSPNFN
jgi:hypothetical protein